MATGLYGRVSARGFPSSVAAGLTGEGALESQGTTVDPAHGQAVTTDRPSTLTPFDPEAVAPFNGIPILLGAFGLPGGTLPDMLPDGHAAPVPGFAGSYDDPALLDMRAKSDAIHAVDFGTLANRTHSTGSLGREPDYDRWTSNDPGGNVMQPVRGQLQAMGGRDTTQGYDRRNSYGLDAGHRDRIVATEPQPMAYLNPAERVFIVPQAGGSFTPTDAYQGPGQWASAWSGESISYTPPTGYAPPAQPETLTGQQQGAPVSSGWWA